MKLSIEKTVTEEIEIAVPCYRKRNGDYFHITEQRVLNVRDNQITHWQKDGYGDITYKSQVKQAFAGTEITEAEFEEKYNEVVASFRVNNSLTVAV